MFLGICVQDVCLLKVISDKIATVSFTQYLSRNIGKKHVRIVVTPIMKELFEKVTKVTTEETTGYLIMGPHGTGKTTAIFWLYHIFKDNREYEVYSVPLKLESITKIYEKLTSRRSSESITKKILLLADSNELQSCNPDDIDSLTHLQLLVRNKLNGFVIMAASSYQSKTNQNQGSYPI